MVMLFIWCKNNIMLHSASIDRLFFHEFSGNAVSCTRLTLDALFSSCHNAVRFVPVKLLIVTIWRRLRCGNPFAYIILN